MKENHLKRLLSFVLVIAMVVPGVLSTLGSMAMF